MRKCYIVATKAGERPSQPQADTKLLEKALQTCKTGWPSEEWDVFQIQIEKGASKSHRPTLHLEGENAVINNLAANLAKRYDAIYIVMLNGKCLNEGV